MNFPPKIADSLKITTYNSPKHELFSKKIHIHTIFSACLLAIFTLLSLPSVSFADALDDDLAEQWTTRNIPAQTGERLHSAAHRFEIALHIGVIPSDDYYTYFPLILDLHYRFTEMWGLNLRGSLLKLHADSTLYDFMDKHQASIAAKMLADEQLGDVALMATFHPIYGKWTAETYNLGRFDWGLFAGVGVVFSNTPNKSFTKQSLSAHAQGILGSDAHFFLLSWLALRLEASLRFYKTPNQWIVPATLSLGLSFFLPSLKSEAK